MLVGGGACDGHTSTVTVRDDLLGHHTHTHTHTHRGFPILGSSVSEDTLSSVRRELLPVFLPWV